MATSTVVPLTLLNSDQPRCAVEEYHCIAPLHFDVISVTTRKKAVERQVEIITRKSKYRLPSSNYC